MNWRISISPVVLSAVLLGWGLWAAEPAQPGGEAETARIQSLVRQLGDEQFAVREQATAELLQVGLPAMGALEAGANHSDREIRYRASRILNLVREMDFERRLAGFAAGREGSEYALPGWPDFRDRFEDTPETRSLFVDMQKAEPEVMQAVGKGPQGLAPLVGLRCLEIQQNQRFTQRQAGVGNVMALLFAISSEQVTMDFQAETALASLCYQPLISTAIENPEQGPILKKLLGAWIERGDGWTAYQGLTLAMRYDLKEGLIPALNVVKNPGNQAYIRQHGILAIAKFGDKSHEEVLEAMLDDETQCSSQRDQDKTYLTQIRDVALAALLLLRKEDPEKFGFERITLHPTNVFITNTVGFENDEARQVVFDKWSKRKADEEKNRSQE